MNQIGPNDAPEPRLLAKWLYDRMKKHPLMRRHIDQVRDAPQDSEVKSFAWLWDKIESCIQESQLEQNALSIQEALKRGPTKVKKEEASGMAAKAGKSQPKGKGDATKGKSKGDGKGKGSRGGSPSKSSQDKPEKTPIQTI
jgi:hypothetical protein